MKLQHFRRQLKLAAFFLLLTCNCHNPYPVAPQNESASLITDGQFPSISPSGTQLAFVRNGKILVANLDGTGEVEIAARGVQGNCLPRWSPDGSRIGFIRSDARFTGQLYAIDPRTKAEVLLSGPDTVSFDLDGSDGPGPYFDWSPSRNRIAFLSYSSGDLYIKVIEGDGSARRLYNILMWRNNGTYYPLYYYGFSWSPDGNQIVFSSNAESDSVSLYIANIDQNSIFKVKAGRRIYSPSWSPDGNSIALQNDYFGETLVLFNLQSKSDTALVAPIRYPKFSPNGVYILFWFYYQYSNPDQPSTSKLMFYDLSEKKSIDVTNTSPGYYFTWHPSSKSVFYSNNQKIYRADIK